MLVDYEYRLKNGMKMDGKTELKNRTLKIRLANEASIYTAELSAIPQALSLIEKETEARWVIFSDSLSFLHAIESMHPKSNPILLELVFFFFFFFR
jgi:hypothetical protein